MEAVRKVTEAQRVWRVSGKCLDGAEGHMRGGRNGAEMAGCWQAMSDFKHCAIEFCLYHDIR